MYLFLRILVFLENIEYFSNANHNLKTVFHADRETDVGGKFWVNYTPDIDCNDYNRFHVRLAEKENFY